MLQKFNKRVSKYIKSLAVRERDPRYMFILFGSVLVFLVTLLQVLSAGLFDSIERPVFEFVNSLPGIFYGVMFALTQFGGLGTLVLWIGLAWYLIDKRAAINLAATGVSAWFLARLAKILIHRGRPQDFLESIVIFKGESFSGFGFPSGHATFSAACATVLYYQISPKYRKYLILIVLLVGISRIYLGAHFPLDIVGGWALGAIIGAASSLIFGVYKKGLSLPRLRKYLKLKGYFIKTLKIAGVDARGSKPLFIQTRDGKHYFGKIFGKQEHAADWLFKIFRFFRYKNLQAEEPYLRSRRNIEIESFAMLWAAKSGVRVPKVQDVLRYGSSWLLIQERIYGKPLSEHGHLLQRSLEDAWVQTEKLHSANVAHRDLRAANLLIDKKGKVWIIDFGFAEVSANNQRKYMDVAELLMSMALAAGTKRTLDAAFKILPPEKLARTLPYLQTAVFSGATTKQLRHNRQLLKDLKEEAKERLGINEEIDEANILRLNTRKAINLIILATFLYVIAPQFGAFRDALKSADITNKGWLIPLGIASLLTYIFTGLVYVALANVPLKIKESALVQLASSFVSKILPGGLGGTALNTKYLTKAGADVTESSAIIAAQGVIGFLMFTVPLGIFLMINGGSVSDLINIKIDNRYLILGAVVGTILIISIGVIRKLRTFVLKRAASFIESVQNISAPTREITLAAGASFAVTLSYILCLYASFKAFGIPLGLTAAILVYASAVIARSAIPTPGGLGPLEAAMIASMIGFGATTEQAFPVVLIYRLATFWLPIPFSLLAYKYITAKKLI